MGRLTCPRLQARRPCTLDPDTVQSTFSDAYEVPAPESAFLQIYVPTENASKPALIRFSTDWYQIHTTPAAVEDVDVYVRTRLGDHIDATATTLVIHEVTLTADPPYNDAVFDTFDQLDSDTYAIADHTVSLAFTEPVDRLTLHTHGSPTLDEALTHIEKIQTALSIAEKSL